VRSVAMAVTRSSLTGLAGVRRDSSGAVQNECATLHAIVDGTRHLALAAATASAATHVPLRGSHKPPHMRWPAAHAPTRATSWTPPPAPPAWQGAPAAWAGPPTPASRGGGQPGAAPEVELLQAAQPAELRRQHGQSHCVEPTQVTCRESFYITVTDLAWWTH
jgi:hypothetical protein